MPEAVASGFDSPPSLALEEEFTASEADYSPTTPLNATMSHQEAKGEPAQEVGVEARTPRAILAEPTAESSASVQANAAGEAAPVAAEPPRPRRSGWWQRARATVIGK